MSREVQGRNASVHRQSISLSLSVLDLVSVTYLPFLSPSLSGSPLLVELGSMVDSAAGEEEKEEEEGEEEGEEEEEARKESKVHNTSKKKKEKWRICIQVLFTCPTSTHLSLPLLLSPPKGCYFYASVFFFWPFVELQMCTCDLSVCVCVCVPNHQRWWYPKWKLSWNAYTLHARFFVTFGGDLNAQSVLINKISTPELSRKFIKSALLVG